MGFNLTKYQNADRHEVTIALPGHDDALVVGYLPRKLSTAALARAERETKKEGLELAARDGLVDTLTALILDWNVTDGDEQPAPVTRAFISSLPDDLLGKLIEGILNDAPKASAPKRRR